MHDARRDAPREAERAQEPPWQAIRIHALLAVVRRAARHPS